MEKQNTLDKFGKRTALISFLGGSVLLIWYYYSSSLIIASIGYIFIVTALLVNAILAFILLLTSLVDRERRRSYLKTLGLMLLNAPVAILYFLVVVYLTGTMRVTFINETGQSLTNVSISGCEAKTIQHLSVDEDETVWLNIPRDCSIEIEYIVDGNIVREVVFGYATHGMGTQITYRIGTTTEPLDD